MASAEAPATYMGSGDFAPSGVGQGAKPSEAGGILAIYNIKFYMKICTKCVEFTNGYEIKQNKLLTN